jgi:hypothetical protein
MGGRPPAQLAADPPPVPDPLTVLAALPRPLSVWSADGICGQLRDALGREAGALAAAVEQLRAALEEEADRCSAARAPPPSVADLQATVDALQTAVGERAALQRGAQPEAPCKRKPAAQPRPPLPPAVARRPVKPLVPAPQPRDNQQVPEAEGCTSSLDRQRGVSQPPGGNIERGPGAAGAPPHTPSTAPRCGHLPAVPRVGGRSSKLPASCALPPLRVAQATQQAALPGDAALVRAGCRGAR